MKLRKLTKKDEFLKLDGLVNDKMVNELIEENAITETTCSKCGGEGEVEIKNNFDDGRGDYVWQDCDECVDTDLGRMEQMFTPRPVLEKLNEFQIKDLIDCVSEMNNTDFWMYDSNGNRRNDRISHEAGGKRKNNLLTKLYAIKDDLYALERTERQY